MIYNWIKREEENLIMKDKHHKHPALAKPERGMYHCNEWAIYGTTCGRIESFVKGLNNRLAEKYNLTYVDAAHNVEDPGTDMQIGKKQFSQSKAISWNEYDDRLQSWHTDAVVVNGNHYPAQRQIVFIDQKKEASLLRRVEQLNLIDAVVRFDDTPIYGFVKEKINESTLVISIDEINKVDQLIIDQIEGNKSPLKALILAGGKSKRMGEDKSQMHYHGKPQEVFAADICAELGLETFISKAYSFTADTIDGYPVIKDRLVDMGPFGAILSAMMSDPDAAWLVLACDLPYITRTHIRILIDNRNTSQQSTAYKLINQSFPEPLIAIYEPTIYQRMLRFLSLGYACPRKVLINSDVYHVDLLQAQVGYNANTTEEKEQVLNKLSQ